MRRIDSSFTPVSRTEHRDSIPLCTSKSQCIAACNIELIKLIHSHRAFPRHVRIECWACTCRSTIKTSTSREHYHPHCARTSNVNEIRKSTSYAMIDVKSTSYSMSWIISAGSWWWFLLFLCEIIFLSNLWTVYLDVDRIRRNLPLDSHYLSLPLSVPLLFLSVRNCSV